MQELLTMASYGKDWKTISAESSVMSPAPSRNDPIGQWTEMNWTTVQLTQSKLQSENVGPNLKTTSQNEGILADCSSVCRNVELKPGGL